MGPLEQGNESQSRDGDIETNVPAEVHRPGDDMPDF
jgi:hypothetical protein